AGAGASQRPTVKVYDTGEVRSSVWGLYQRAVRAGADFVVGPLRKESVAVLASAYRLEVPVLALNYVDQPEPPDTLYQFGLLPEDEARQAAERAWFDGHERALALAPAGTWGDRVVNAFRERFEALGGRVVEEQRYDPQKSDFSRPITRMLNLDESHARHRRLATLLKRKLSFKPRRRQDADLVFTGAFPRQARLIRPQLRFHHASDLPVYATSHVYQGHPRPAADRDMDGIVFCDTPWTLRPEGPAAALRAALSEHRGDAVRAQGRLYALGVDAHDLIPYLQHLERDRYRRYTGVTGRLSMDPRRRLHRALACARFEAGRPVLAPLAASPVGAPEGAAPEGPRDDAGPSL
ncbi:MAG: penicillin-binding protein activator, partial [Gammaproteobacteria bacterium]|nr:penicillin-binding protein activator [Gammaproteobacteria bacterium]